MAYFYFGEDLPWTIPKTGSVHFALFWLGIWWTKLNRVWGSSPVLWFASKSVGNFNPISLGKRGLVHSISAVSMPIVLKTMKKQHKFVENLSTSKGKFQDEPRRQIEIERRYLSRGLKSSVGLCDCWRPRVFTKNWLCFCCFVCLEKPCQAFKGKEGGVKGGVDRGRAGGSVLLIGGPSQNAPLRNLTSPKNRRGGSEGGQK